MFKWLTNTLEGVWVTLLVVSLLSIIFDAQSEPYIAAMFVVHGLILVRDKDAKAK